MRGMRTLFGICIFVVFGLCSLIIFSSGPTTTSTTLHSLVTQTHQQLNQLHKLKEEFEGEPPVDINILNDLGFIKSPILFPNHTWSHLSSPAIVTSISSNQVERIPDLIQLSFLLSSNASVVIFGLDLTPDEVKQVENECNDTCKFFEFDFSLYPSHVRDLRLSAYRPIIIQEMLQRSGIILWLDSCMAMIDPVNEFASNSTTKGYYFKSEKESYSENLGVDRQIGKDSIREAKPVEPFLLDSLVKKAMMSEGVVSWSVDDFKLSRLPTSAMTHPDMFTAFRVQKRDYDFQQMSSPKAIVLVNLPKIHFNLMRPWIRCALRQSCLSPIGAQDTGCRYDKKPIFRYSGCHLYDASAFNIALGLNFGPDNAKYLNPDRVFQCITESVESRTPEPNSLSTSNGYSTWFTNRNSVHWAPHGAYHVPLKLPVNTWRTQKYSKYMKNLDLADVDKGKKSDRVGNKFSKFKRDGQISSKSYFSNETKGELSRFILSHVNNSSSKSNSSEKILVPSQDLLKYQKKF